MDATLLIVDDEAELRDVLTEFFSRHDFRVLTAGTAAQARALLGGVVPQVAVLDVHMPGEDGLSLARWMREHHPGVGIVMLSAAAEVIDRIVGLEVGADDYVPKPFEVRELLARVKSLLRRTQAPAADAPAGGVHPRPPGKMAFGSFRLDLDRRCLVGPDGADVEITASEYDLLALFARNPHRALSRDQIMEGAHNRSWDVFDRSIDLRIMRLRRKLERNPDKPELLKTVRGVGYMFVPADEPGTGS